MTPRDEIDARLARAEAEILSAESALEVALGELVALPREQKVAISPGVEHAFVTLRIARARLAAIRAQEP